MHAVQSKEDAYPGARGLSEVSDGADSDDSIKDNGTARAVRKGKIDEKRRKVAQATTLTHSPCLPPFPLPPPSPPPGGGGWR